MSFGSGHVMDMISRMKQNRAQRPSKKSKFKENNRQTIYSKKDKLISNTKFKTVSKTELAAIKKQIVINAKARKLKHKILYTILISLGICSFVIFILMIN
nr:hypothetical protein [uncultured Psychroserpens sp.]